MLMSHRVQIWETVFESAGTLSLQALGLVCFAVRGETKLILAGVTRMVKKCTCTTAQLAIRTIMY